MKIYKNTIEKRYLVTGIIKLFTSESNKGFASERLEALEHEINERLLTTHSSVCRIDHIKVKELPF